jgi:hypothetical protein
MRNVPTHGHRRSKTGLEMRSSVLQGHRHTRFSVHDVNPWQGAGPAGPAESIPYLVEVEADLLNRLG